MKKILVFIVAALLASCTKTDNPYVPSIDFQGDKKASELIAADNAFAMNLFKEVYESEEAENFMLSPLSVAIALGMTYNGSEGGTKAAFEEVLGFSGYSRHEINNIHGALMEHLLKVDQKVIFEIANSLWFNDRYTIEKEFADTNVFYYNAEINSLNFSDPASVDIINNWVSDKTNEKIPTVLDAKQSNSAM